MIAKELCCPFCETLITETKEDGRGVNTPFCEICGVIVSLVWNIRRGIRTSLEVRFSPRPESNRADLIIDNELQQEVADDPSAVSGAPATQASTDRQEAIPLPNHAARNLNVASKVLSLFEVKPTVTTGRNACLDRMLTRRVEQSTPKTFRRRGTWQSQARRLPTHQRYQ